VADIAAEFQPQREIGMIQSGKFGKWLLLAVAALALTWSAAPSAQAYCPTEQDWEDWHQEEHWEGASPEECRESGHQLM
jgi:hypothetical protein